MALIEDLLATHPHLTFYAYPTLDEHWYSRLSWPGGEMMHRYDGSMTVSHQGEALYHHDDFGARSIQSEIPKLRAALEAAGLVWPEKYDRRSAWPTVQWPPLRPKKTKTTVQKVEPLKIDWSQVGRNHPVDCVCREPGCWDRGTSMERRQEIANYSEGKK